MLGHIIRYGAALFPLVEMPSSIARSSFVNVTLLQGAISPFIFEDNYVYIDI